MSRGFFNALLGLFAIGAVGAFLFLRPTESRRVVKAVEAMAREASYKPSEGSVRRLARMETLVNSFTEDAVLRFESLGMPSGVLSGRDEIRQLAGAAFRLPGGLEVQCFDPVVDLGPEPDTAKVHLTATATSGRQEAFTAQEFEFKLVKKEGRWLVREVNTVRTLRR